METEIKIGEIFEAEVTKITDFGAFVNFNRQKGLIHISQISDNFVKDINQHLKVGDKVKARVIKIGPGKKIDLSLRSSPLFLRRSAEKQKQNRPPFEKRNSQPGFKSSDFEEKLKRFLQQSDQR